VLAAGTPLPNAKWFGKPNPEPYRCDLLLFGCGMLAAAAVAALPSALSQALLERIPATASTPCMLQLHQHMLWSPVALSAHV
jgi:hypothetical protein